jgi:hypothetical protein
LSAERRAFTAELPAQDDPEIGRELIRVRHDDGTVEELRLHDYERLYSLPGLYEQIVQERLRCRSPSEIASMLAAAADRIGWDRAQVRVIDVAAGNGVSGEALAAEGLRAVLGTDIVPAARAAALRDRPSLYDQYLTLDLLALTAGEERVIRELGANALSCVAPVGEHSQQLPPPALAAAVGLLAPDALVAYMYDLTFGTPDAITPAFWTERLGASTHAEELERRRYVHRYTVGGEPFEMDGVVWRVRRD